MALPSSDSLPAQVPLNLLTSDRFLDHLLDELTERAGHPRHTDALGLARWDAKAALINTIQKVYKR